MPGGNAPPGNFSSVMAPAGADLSHTPPRDFYKVTRRSFEQQGNGLGPSSQVNHIGAGNFQHPTADMNPVEISGNHQCVPPGPMGNEPPVHEQQVHYNDRHDMQWVGDVMPVVQQPSDKLVAQPHQARPVTPATRVGPSMEQNVTRTPTNTYDHLPAVQGQDYEHHDTDSDTESMHRNSFAGRSSFQDLQENFGQGRNSFSDLQENFGQGNVGRQVSDQGALGLGRPAAGFAAGSASAPGASSGEASQGISLDDLARNANALAMSRNLARKRPVPIVVKKPDVKAVQQVGGDDLSREAMERETFERILSFRDEKHERNSFLSFQSSVQDKSPRQSPRLGRSSWADEDPRDDDLTPLFRSWSNDDSPKDDGTGQSRDERAARRRSFGKTNDSLERTDV
jgi:hypothetical protein